jgi:plasmid stabilization system protein ParE
MLIKAAKADLKAIGRDTQATWGRVQRSRYLTLLDEGLRALTDNPQNFQDYPRRQRAKSFGHPAGPPIPHARSFPYR